MNKLVFSFFVVYALQGIASTEDDSSFKPQSKHHRRVSFSSTLSVASSGSSGRERREEEDTEYWQNLPSTNKTLYDGIIAFLEQQDPPITTPAEQYLFFTLGLDRFDNVTFVDATDSWEETLKETNTATLPDLKKSLAESAPSTAASGHGKGGEDDGPADTEERKRDVPTPPSHTGTKEHHDGEGDPLLIKR